MSPLLTNSFSLLQTVLPCAGAAVALFTNCSFLCSACFFADCSLLSLCRDAAVCFIYKLFLAVQGLLFALFTNCFLLCRGCCSHYLQTVPCCAGPAVCFIYNCSSFLCRACCSLYLQRVLPVQGLLFALFINSYFLLRDCCSLYLQRVPSCSGTAVCFIYKLFLAV